MTQVKNVLCQKWEESERGWGSSPDGYSLHVDKEALAKFVDAYWKTMPDEVPDEYSRPDGTPYWCTVDDETYQQLMESEHGIWKHGVYPGSGGTDGWIPLCGGGHGKR